MAESPDYEPTGASVRRRMAEEIIEILRREILTGKVAGGSRLPSEREIAVRFGVSQPTVREALRALDSMGLIEVRHGSGTFVRSDAEYSTAVALQNLLQLRDIGILDVLDVRQVLGLESARRAAMHADEADIETLRDRLAAFLERRDTADLTRVLRLISEFQEALSRAAKNPLLFAIESFLIKLVLQLQISPVGSRGAANWQRRSMAFQEDREAIVKAVADHDPRAAEYAMANYLAHQRKVFLQDPELGLMRMNDPKALSSVAEVVDGFRGRRGTRQTA